ncbi:hypothetical protein [Lysobacter enzymogenes]|uniref:hypothetical protein n=1 Tax=Lysobacter enzymogenes TaxID=69 RepID=UPI001A9725A6|nr:hypothetical protein [Lysobacter enzymogenes]QQP95936.1 hypothetical protein JHW38_22420 [Lysobacter enzymogenes]
MIEDIEVLKDTELAFGGRPRPVVLVKDGPVDEIRKDAEAVSGLRWSEIDCETLEKYPDCIYGFTSEGFRYFLPGVICASVRERRPDLLVVDSLVQQLDRSGDPENWDDSFAERWPLLDPDECAAVSKWILWLSERSDFPDPFDSLGRALDLLVILRRRASLRT